MAEPGRYAVYFMPQGDSELAGFGEAVLGRDAFGNAVAPPSPDHSARGTLTATPAFYGFHATLKAPFHLAEGETVEALEAALGVIAADHHALPLDTLYPSRHRRFVALITAEENAGVNRLAEACVVKLEQFRAPLSEEDIARRQPEKLNDRQRRYLDEFGYPHVLEDFRFHMTLTASLNLPDTITDDFLQWLTPFYDCKVKATPILDQLVLCEQTNRSRPLVQRVAFPLVSES